MTQHRRPLDMARIDIEGDERRSWLSGQLTCDLSTLEPGGAISGLLLTPKGKILADVWVLESDEALHLVLPAEVKEAAVERLERFLVMEDVDLEVSDETLVSVQGPGAVTALSPHVERVWPVRRWSSEGAEAWVPEERRPAILEAIGETSEAAWNDARIRAGRPALNREMGAHTLPQELGLYDAISFEKGCYIGQEPVVMLEHRGKAPKRLARVSGENLEEGLALTSEGKTAGTLTSVTQDAQVGLALIKRAFHEAELSVNDQPVHVELLRFD